MAKRSDPTLLGPQHLTTVVAGTRVKLVSAGYLETSVTHPTVGRYHRTPKGNEHGHWYCVTHERHFENQFGKDIHISEGTHEMAWICHQHGIEQPMKDAVTA